MKRNLLSVLSAMFLLAVAFACVDHEVPQDVVSQKGLPLSGDQESPFKTTGASGWADVSYNKTTKMLTYQITWNNLTGNPTGAHIHGTAFRGMNAGIKHDFFSLIPKTTSGTYSGSVMVDGTTINETDLLNGKYYFNFHTPLNPGGEIRGQIEFYDQPHIVTKWGLPIDVMQEVPPKTTGASGTADVSYNKMTKVLSYHITWKDLTSIPTGAHIHGPAPKGTNAGIKHDFFALIPKTLAGSFSNSVVVDGTAINETDLLDGKYYFNIHNIIYPGGEIRGQIEF
jgi:Cu/Zn superoxide dismutase